MLSAAALILISVARLHAFVPGLSVIRPGLITLLVGLAALVTSYSGPRRLKYLNSRLGKLMVFFVVWATLGVPFAMYKGRALSAVAEGLWVETLVILIVVAAVRNTTDLKRLLAVFAFGATAFAFLATGTGGRAVGGGGYDPNDAAMFIVSGIPLIFFFLVKAANPLLKFLFALGIVVCGSAVVISGSRGGFLALVAIMGYSLFFLEGIRPGLRVVVVAAAALVVVFQADAQFWERIESIAAEDDYNRVSYTGRQQVWERGMGYMFQNPVFGVGVNNFSFAEANHPTAVARLERGFGVKFSSPHSIWVQVASETGIPGFLAFSGIFLYALRYLWAVNRNVRRHASESPELRPLRELGRPVLGVLVAVIIAGSFLSRAYTSVVWMPLGMALAIQKLTLLKERELLRTTAPAPARSRPRSPNETGRTWPPNAQVAARPIVR